MLTRRHHIVLEQWLIMMLLMRYAIVCVLWNQFSWVDSRSAPVCRDIRLPFSAVCCLWKRIQNHPTHRSINTLRPRQDGRDLADDIFKCIFINENFGISLKISLKFVPKVRINNIPALVQIMAWCRPGDRPLPEPVMVRLPTHICVTRHNRHFVGISKCHFDERNIS